MGQGVSGERVEDRYFLQKVKLGQGSFGVVWRAIDRRTNEVVAIKQLDKAKMPSRGVRREDIEREVQMMKAARHVNLTELKDTFEDQQSIYLALEYCDGGDFGDKVKEKGMALQESDAAGWMRQICSAIFELHSKGVCHRDIKPDNFMVHGADPGSLKLTDFGLALILPRGKLLTEKCGTPAFMAPEQHRLPRNSRGYGFPVDMWAAGVSMYMVMFGGRHPFLTTSNQLDNNALLSGTLDFCENRSNTFFGFGGGGQERYSDMCRSVCRKMVDPDQQRRITAEDALRDPWINPGRRRHSVPAGANAPPQGAAGGLARAPQQSWWPFIQGDGTANVGGMAASPAHQTSKDHAMPMGSPLAPGGATPSTTGSSRSGARQLVGYKCRYYSRSQNGWVDAVVESVNDNGTFNLDVKLHAEPDKISPRLNIPPSEAWPPNTWVYYKSSTVQAQIPSVVISWNSSDGTYNLECRDHADVDRIRPRLVEVEMGQAPAVASVAPQQPAISRTTTRKGMPQAMGDGDASYAGYRDGTPDNPMRVADMADVSRRGSLHQAGGLPAVPAVRLVDLPHVFCMINDPSRPDGSFSVLAEVNEFNEWQGTCVVTPVHPAPQQQLTLSAEQVRAPRVGEGSQSWPPGTKVEYESPSMAQWIPALVHLYNVDDRTYNLDVRDHAACERVRPRLTNA